MHGSHHILVHVYLLKMLFFVRFVILPKKTHEIVYCEGKVDKISITNLKTYPVQKLFKVKGWDGRGRG